MWSVVKENRDRLQPGEYVEGEIPRQVKRRRRRKR